MPNIQITDLIDNAVENALARREEALTTEESSNIQGGRFSTESSPTRAGAYIPPLWPNFDPPKTVKELLHLT